jgi:hypothetical protein
VQKWRRCRKRLHVLGPDGLHHKMSKVNVKDIHPEVAARARVLLEEHDIADIQSAGPGVAAIHKWVRASGVVFIVVVVVVVVS